MEAEHNMANRIQIRRDTAANWQSVNPTLTQGELAYELDTGRLKVGNGLSNWAALSYFNDGQNFSGNYAELTGAPTTLSAFTNDSEFITLADIPTVTVPTLTSELTNDSGFITSDYTPTTPADWNGTPPATIAEAIDRLATRIKLIDGGTGA